MGKVTHYFFSDNRVFRIKRLYFSNPSLTLYQHILKLSKSYNGYYFLNDLESAGLAADAAAQPTSSAIS